MTFEVKRLDAARVPDFWRIHCDENAGSGWCCCVAWWVPSLHGWPERTAAQNRALREELLAREEFDGYLCYCDGVPVGWCQVGPRDRLPRLRRTYDLAADPGVWAVTCFNVVAGERRRGIARAMLAFLIGDLHARGVRRLQAFPRRGGDLPDGEAWTGPETLFREAGFQIEGEAERGPIYGRDLTDIAPCPRTS